MALSEEGMYSKLLAGWQRHVASSETFQDLVGAADEAAAIDRVWPIEAIDRPNEEDTDAGDTRSVISELPRAIVDVNENFESELKGTGEFIRTGDLFAGFELVLPAEYEEEEGDSPAEIVAKWRDANTWLANKAGKIRDEVEANSGGNGANGSYIALLSLSFLSMPQWSSPDDTTFLGGFAFQGRYH